MGFADLAQKMAQAGYKLAGNIKVTCTYNHKGVGVYAGGLYTYPDEVNSTGLKFLFEDYQDKEVDGSVFKSTDQKISIAQLDLVDSSGDTITPAKKDTITDSDSRVWTIEGIGKDAARATWRLQGREP